MACDFKKLFLSVSVHVPVRQPCAALAAILAHVMRHSDRGPMTVYPGSGSLGCGRRVSNVPKPGRRSQQIASIRRLSRDQLIDPD
jgi:hypothetical protein